MSAGYCRSCGAPERAFARPSLALEHHAEAIVALAARYGINHVRVFGSCVTGADDWDSNINLIGTLAPTTGYFGLGAFVGSVEELTGYPVDFEIDDAERPSYLNEVQMVPLVEEPGLGIGADDEREVDR